MMREAERGIAGLGTDPQFAILKLQVLASFDEDEAGRHYVRGASKMTRPCRRRSRSPRSRTFRGRRRWPTRLRTVLAKR